MKCPVVKFAPVLVFGLIFCPNFLMAQPSTNGLLLWLDASYRASIQTNSSGGVTNWINLAPGATNSVSYSGANDNGTSASYNTTPPTYVINSNGLNFVNFSGAGYLDNLNLSAITPASITVFLLASATSNPGNYSAFLSFRQGPSANDYQTGLNIDQGQNSSATFNRLNVEGAKAGGNGGFQFLNGSLNFGTVYIIQVNDGGGPADNNNQVGVLVNDTLESFVTGTNTPVGLANCYIGTRAYVVGFVPTSNHDLIGKIAVVLVYSGQLSDTNLTQTTDYLYSFFRPPNLGIAYTTTNNSVKVFWLNSGNYTLVQSSILATNLWVTNTLPVSTINGTNSVIVTPPKGNLFFRLATQ
jgi:hypothetical protein